MKYLTEKYRRGIVLPLNDNTERLVRAFQFDYKSKIDTVSINENDNIYDVIWESGLIHKINNKINTSIDDYEEEIIEYNQLDVVLKILKKFNFSTTHENKLSVFVENLISLIEKAIRLKRPVCFIF